MGNRIEEELKIERNKQSHVDAYQQYHLHSSELEAIERENGGRRYKKLDATNHPLNAVFSHFVKH